MYYFSDLFGFYERANIFEKQFRYSNRFYNMKQSKKIFLLIAIVFLIIMAVIGYDISSRTTWPGAKKNLKERIEDKVENE